MKYKTLTIICYTVITKENNNIFLNDKIGILLDNLSKYFSTIFFLCMGVEKNNKTFYPSGHSLYKYKVKSSNIIFVETATERSKSLLNKIIEIIKKIPILINYIKKSDICYIFLPQITGIIAGFICLYLKKPFFLYFGSDWQEVAPFMVKWSKFTTVTVYPIYYFLVKILEKYIAKKAKFILVHGEKLYKKFYKLNSSTYPTIPMITINQTDIYYREDTCQNSKIICLYVGPIIPRKGLKYLLESIYMLLPKYNNLEVLLVGSIDAEYYKLLNKKINELGLKQKINFTGYINDKEVLLQYYRTADIFILPTLGEGFPRVIYEAMSQGLPVITTKINSICEQIINNNQAILVKPGDTKELADAIEEVIRNVCLRRSLIRNGYEYVKNKIKNRTQAEQVHNLINQNCYE